MPLESQFSTESKFHQKQTKESPKKWNLEKSELYHKTVKYKEDRVKSVENVLSNTILENISVKFINIIVKNISNVLVESAKNAFGIKPVFTNTGETFYFKNKKPWFTRDCKNVRRIGGNVFQSDLYKKEQLYKKVLKYECNAKSRHEKNIFSLVTNNLKEYWNILNTNTDKKRCHANLFDLLTFCKECCKTNYNEQEESNTVYFLSMC